MAEPTPTPTADQLVTVAEIMMISADEVLALVSVDAQSISDAKWSRTLTDITTWAGIVDEFNDIKRVGSIEFFEKNIVTSRTNFRNKLRLRYGLTALATEEASSEMEGMSSLRWFE